MKASEAAQLTLEAIEGFDIDKYLDTISAAIRIEARSGGRRIRYNYDSNNQHPGERTRIAIRQRLINDGFDVKPNDGCYYYQKSEEISW